MGLNRIERGASIMIAIPAGGCISGGTSVAGVPVLIGADMVGVPEGTYGAGALGNVTVHLVGVFGNIAKKTTDTFNAGDKLYLDTTNSYLTTTSSGDNVFAGWAWVAGLNTDTACIVRLKQG